MACCAAGAFRCSSRWRAAASPARGSRRSPTTRCRASTTRRHVRSVVIEREWPQSTRQISELRVVIDYQSARRRDAHADARHRRLSGRMAARPAAARQELRAMVGGDARRICARTTRASAAAAVARASRGRRSARARRRERGASKRRGCSPTICRPAARSTTTLSMVAPGRFLMPGDLAGSPALTFAPLALPGDGEPPPGSIWAMMRAALRFLSRRRGAAVLPRSFRAARPADRAGRCAGRARWRPGGDARSAGRHGRGARLFPGRARRLAQRAVFARAPTASCSRRPRPISCTTPPTTGSRRSSSR